MDPMILHTAHLGASPAESTASRPFHPEQDGASPSGSGPQLLSLERELSGPGAREALARHDAVLLGLETRLAAALREGVAPDDYAKLTTLREANVLARKLLRLAVREGESNQN